MSVLKTPSNKHNNQLVLGKILLDHLLSLTPSQPGSQLMLLPWTNLSYQDENLG